MGDIELESKRFYVNDRAKEVTMGVAKLEHKVTLDPRSDTNVELLTENRATNMNGRQM